MKVAIDQASSQSEVSAAASRVTRGRQRLRPRRFAIPRGTGNSGHAQAEHPSLGSLEATVLDLSLHGALLELPQDTANGVLLGDRLSPLSIHYNGHQVCVGVGVVTRVTQRDTVVELGIDLRETAIQLDQVYRASTRQAAEQRWQAVYKRIQVSRVLPEFRAWVAQLATFLLAVKQFFDQEQKELALWDHDTQRTVGEELLAAVTPDLSRRLNAAAIELGELAAQIPQELEAEHRAFIQSQLNPYLEAAPFIWRVKHKPLGYAGDYEMMNMLYRDHREGDGLFAKALNVWATSQPAARANINRIEYIGSKLQETIRSRPEGVVRVASIGCGPAQEIYSFLKRYPELGRRLDIALIDQEEKAIDYCERSLAPLAAGTGAHIRVIKDSARRLLTDRRLAASLGECDLLYSAGLFDYLAARSFSALLATLYGALAPDGVLLIGNVAQHNPDRAQMEYIGEWYLHHRSPDELLALAGNLQPVPKRVSVDAEPTGVNLFLVVER